MDVQGEIAREAGAERVAAFGRLLMREAVRLVREAGARTVDLTSRADRASANRLYERLGFTVREATVYRMPLDG
ncbi:GNAT family N-acetyltransferase [Streptomyces sp. NBC_00299]|uniref:GNAT family N-acetyltransferase n=1 Tax=Streptomyces sp. NBC_00299 TaxID=2975705 RepID=UPI003FA68CE5